MSRSIERMYIRMEKGRNPSGQDFDILRQSIGDIKNLSSSMDQILDNPRQYDYSKFYLDFGAATLLPATSDVLTSSWKKLSHELQNTEISQRSIIAFCLADSLLYQTALPFTEKYSVRYLSSEKSGLKAKIGSPGPEFQQAGVLRTSVESTQEREKLVRARDKFNDHLGTVIEKTPDSLETVSEQLQLLDATVSLFDSEPFRLQYALGTPGGNERFETLYGHSVTKALESPFAQDQLLAGKLEDTDSHIRGQIWQSSLLNASDKKISEYFFTHDDLKKVYWNSATLPQKFISAPLAEQIPKEQVTNISTSYAIAEWFFLQDPQTMQDFLTTIPEDKKDKELTKKVIGFVALFQNRHPDHSNISVIRETIVDTFQESENTEVIANAFAILSDEVPGRATLGAGGQIRFKRTDQPEINASGLVLHVSKKRSEGEANKSSVPEKKDTESSVYVLKNSQTEFRRYWREVDVVLPEDVPGVLEQLNKQADALPTEDELVTRVDALQNTNDLQTQAIPLLFPSILPEDHQLHVLDTLGIVSVDQQDNTISFIFNPQKIGIQVEDNKKIVMRAEIDAMKDVVIPGAPDDFSLSPIHLLLTEAVLLARQPQPEKKPELTKEEKSSVRGWLKGYKAIAKERHLPPIMLEDAQTQGDKVLFPLKNKTVMLTLSDSTKQ